MKRKRHLQSNECKGTPLKAKEFASSIIKKIMFIYAKQKSNTKTMWLDIKSILKREHPHNYSFVILVTNQGISSQIKVQSTVKMP